MESWHYQSLAGYLNDPLFTIIPKIAMLTNACAGICFGLSSFQLLGTLCNSVATIDARNQMSVVDKVHDPNID